MTLLSALAAGALLVPALALGTVRTPAEGPVRPTLTPVRITAAAPAAARAPGNVPAQGRAGTGWAPVPTGATAALSATAGGWVWPLSPPPAVQRRFAVGPAPWSPGHRGVDLAAAPGASVRAPASGTVHFAGMLAGRPVLSIDHGNGLISSVEPVVSSVRRGQPVAAGQVLGRLGGGPTHCPGSCLHWGVRRDGRYIDPLLLVAAARGPAVLLPMRSP